MTVRELRNMLSRYPDDMPVGVWKFGSWIETQLVLSHERVREDGPNRLVTVDDAELAAQTDCDIALVIDS